MILKQVVHQACRIIQPFLNYKRNRNGYFTHNTEKNKQLQVKNDGCTKYYVSKESIKKTKKMFWLTIIYVHIFHELLSMHPSLIDLVPIYEWFDRHWQMLAFGVSWDSSSRSLQSFYGQRAPLLGQNCVDSKYTPAWTKEDDWCNC